jgi:mRNA-degrading endonuclease toxin of MazEF toxin-antitoxin module
VVARGEVRWLELEEEGRRPVLVLTRDEALPRLRNIVVALVTRTVRGIESEEIGPADGMPVECAVSLDNLHGAARPAGRADHEARSGEDGSRLPGAGSLDRVLIKRRRERPAMRVTGIESDTTFTTSGASSA